MTVLQFLAIFINFDSFAAICVLAMFSTVIDLFIFSAIFNIIGVVILGVEMRNLQAQAGFSVALDSLGAIFCAVGGVLGIFDMQRVCLRTRPELGKGLTRHI